MWYVVDGCSGLSLVWGCVGYGNCDSIIIIGGFVGFDFVSIFVVYGVGVLLMFFVGGVWLL